MGSWSRSTQRLSKTSSSLQHYGETTPESSTNVHNCAELTLEGSADPKSLPSSSKASIDIGASALPSESIPSPFSMGTSCHPGSRGPRLQCDVYSRAFSRESQLPHWSRPHCPLGFETVSAVRSTSTLCVQFCEQEFASTRFVVLQDKQYLNLCDIVVIKALWRVSVARVCWSFPNYCCQGFKLSCLSLLCALVLRMYYFQSGMRSPVDRSCSEQSWNCLVCIFTCLV